MRDNPLKTKLAAGDKVFGSWLVANSPISAEVIGRAGYDFVFIDHEHGPGDLLGAINQINALRAVEGGGPATVIRVPWNDPVYIKRALDTGVEGIMIPMVETADEARAAVAACLYPPAGIRGCALGAIRASGFGANATEYWEKVNGSLAIIVQIETPKAVEHIPEIAEVEGVDVLFVGPGDLTVSSGGRPDSPADEVIALIDRAAASVKESGAKLGTVPFAGRDPLELFGMGYDMVMGHTEMGLLRRAAEAEIAAFRERFG